MGIKRFATEPGELCPLELQKNWVFLPELESLSDTASKIVIIVNPKCKIAEGRVERGLCSTCLASVKLLLPDQIYHVFFPSRVIYLLV